MRRPAAFFRAKADVSGSRAFLPFRNRNHFAAFALRKLVMHGRDGGYGASGMPKQESDPRNVAASSGLVEYVEWAHKIGRMITSRRSEFRKCKGNREMPTPPIDNASCRVPRIGTQCPGCGKVGTVPRSYRGRQIICRVCNTRFTAADSQNRDKRPDASEIVTAVIVTSARDGVSCDEEIVTAEIVEGQVGLPHGVKQRSHDLSINSGLVAGQKVLTAVSGVKGARNVADSTLAAGAAVVSATGLTVAATSGAGIASGLAAAGGIVGGGMAAGPAVLAGGPAYLATKALNSTFFRKDEELRPEESSARSAARLATNIGAAAGVVGTSAAVVAGGASGAAIMSTLATVGGVVGGGAIAGTAVLVAAPAAIAAVAGFGVYRLLGGGRKK
jgi:hypothetical protein